MRKKRNNDKTEDSRNPAMSYVIHADIDERLSMIDREVLGYIRLAIYDNEVCWPSEKTMAEKVGCSVISVKRSVKKLRELGWINKEQRFDDTNVYSVPASSDYKNKEALEGLLTMPWGYHKDTSLASTQVSQRYQGGIPKRCHPVSQRDTKRIIEKNKEKTTTIEEVFPSEETEKKTTSEIIIPETVILSDNDSDTTEEEGLLSFLQTEYQEVLGIAYAPTKGDKTILTELSKYPQDQVEEFISQALKDRKAGKLSFFKIGLVLNRLQKTGITEQPKSHYKLAQWGNDMETLYQHIKTGKIVTFNELPEEEQEYWRE